MLEIKSLRKNFESGTEALKGVDLKNLNQGMFSIYLAQAVKSTKIEITGRLERYRDFVFISDVVDALMLIPKSKKNWIKSND